MVALLLHSGSGIGGDQSGVNLPVPRIQLFGFLGVLHCKRSLEAFDRSGGGQESGRDIVAVGDEDALKIVQRLARLIIFERSHALGQGGGPPLTLDEPADGLGGGAVCGCPKEAGPAREASRSAEPIPHRALRRIMGVLNLESL